MKILQVTNFFKPSWESEGAEIDTVLNNGQHSKRKVILIDVDRMLLFLRSFKIVKTLVKKGYKVEILTWDRTGKKPKIEHIEGCVVHNFRFKPLNSQIWGLIPCYVIWCLYIFFFLLRNVADIYHPENLCNLISVIPIKIITKKKIIYDIADFTAGSFNWPELIRKFLAYLENFCIQFTDGVIIVDEHRRVEINESKVKRLSVVMNCSPDLMNKIKVEREQSKFIIYYGGLIAERTGIRYICEAIRDIENIELIIAGSDEAKMMSILGAQSNIQFVGLLTKEESLRQTCNADVICAFYDPKIPIYRLASPNKLFDALMCGKPIIANSEAMPVANIVRKENCGLLVPYGNILELRDAILKLMKDSNLRTKMGENGRKAFEKEYNWMVMERRLIALYDQIVDTND